MSTQKKAITRLPVDLFGLPPTPPLSFSRKDIPDDKLQKNGAFKSSEAGSFFETIPEPHGFNKLHTLMHATLVLASTQPDDMESGPDLLAPQFFASVFAVRSAAALLFRADSYGFRPIDRAALFGNTPFLIAALDHLDSIIQSAGKGEPKDVFEHYLHCDLLHMLSIHDKVDSLQMVIKYMKLPHLSRLANGYSAFHCAAASGSVGCFHTLSSRMKELNPRESALPFTIPDANGFTPLLTAARHRHTHMLKYFTESGQDLKSHIVNGQKVIYVAIQTDDVDSFYYILTLHDKLSSVENGQHVLLHRAAAYGASRCIAVLIKLGIPVDIVNPSNGYTALIRTLLNGYIDSARILLSLGAKINARDQAKRTVVIWLAGSNRLKELRFALEMGGNVNDQDENGFTALHYACKEGYTEIVKFLLSAKANPLIPNVQKTIPLHWAVFKGSHETMVALLSDSKSAKMMLRYRDVDGSVPLIWAAERGNIGAMKLLIDQGTDINEQDTKCTTPLMLVSMNGYTDACKFLLDNGARIDAQDNDDWNALHHACFQGQDQVVPLLIGAGISPTSPGKFGITPYQCAASKGKLACLQTLCSFSKEGLYELDELKRSCLHWASIEGVAGIVQYLLDQGLPIDSRDHLQRTPLLLALAYGSEYLAELMIDKGASIHAVDQCGMSTLHLAAFTNMCPLIRHLVRGGVSIHGRTTAPTKRLSVNSTPLHAAVAGASPEATAVLLKLGARLDDQDSSRTTPLQLAVKAELADFLGSTFAICRGIATSMKSNGTKEDPHEAHFQPKAFSVTIPVLNIDKLAGSWTLLCTLDKVKLQKSGKTVHKGAWASGPVIEPSATEATGFKIVLSGPKKQELNLGCTTSGMREVVHKIFLAMVAAQAQENGDKEEPTPSEIGDDSLSRSAASPKGTAFSSMSSSSGDPSTLDLAHGPDEGDYYMSEFVCYIDGNRSRERKLIVLNGARVKLRKGAKTECKAPLSKVRFQADPIHPKRFSLVVNADQYDMEARSADELLVMKKLLVDFAPPLEDIPAPEARRTHGRHSRQLRKSIAADQNPPPRAPTRMAYDAPEDRVGYDPAKRSTIHHSHTDAASVYSDQPTHRRNHSPPPVATTFPQANSSVLDQNDVIVPVNPRCASDYPVEERSYRVVHEFRIHSDPA